ncbi:major facilitator superfamily domain-containing protein [Stachybotrys elegans]|uniref:Major facilitator superfamily domain-containing protein n=1 Tax=Stachybotrys elegans TaxID=80388 RepID=A0A8K0T8W8_9HYPO|nr:major facilitator superfamily domain-containing protein [Stachybotrys elegans]
MPSSPSPAAEASETTALLQDTTITTITSNGNGNVNGNGTSSKGSSSSTAAPIRNASSPPLPKFQLLLLCYARMVEPIAFFAIFPFIAQMVQRNGHLPASDVGFYSGLIESLFSATQMFVLIFWGRLSDRVGRRPVLLVSLTGMALGSALFGTAQSLWQMILFRCLAGVFSGSSLIIRTMIAELSTPETQARAFSWFAFSSNLGIFLGPLIGGALADPATQYPGLFKHLPFFQEYPYALPCFVTSIISVSGALVTGMFLEETLHSHDADASHSSEPSPKPMSIWELLKYPTIPTVLVLNGQIMLLAFAFTALLPVFLFTPVDIGGLGFPPLYISLYIAAQGASQASWLLLIFPPLQHRVGTKGVLRICAIAYPFFFVGYIVMNALLRQEGHVAHVWFWIVCGVIAVVGPGVAMAFTAVQLAINDASPDTHVLGTLNALALTSSCAIRAVAPGVATALYAAGVSNNILWGQLAWVVLIPLSTLFFAYLKWLPDDKAPKQPINASD